MADVGTLIIGSFHDIPRIVGTKHFDKVDDEKTFPLNVTLGFRGTFWRIFSDIHEIFAGEHQFSWLDSEWTLRCAYIFRSMKRDVQLYLDDRSHVFVALHVVSKDAKDGKWINSRAFENSMTEQELLSSLFKAIGDNNNLAQIRTASHSRNFPARFLFPTEGTQMNATSVAIMCFYAFAQLVVWQIDRDHASIELRADPLDINKNLVAVLRIRARIINIRRYFLTNNITNDRTNSQYVSMARQYTNLQHKFEGFSETNDLIERFFLTSSQIKINLSTKVLNITALFIAVIGLPTAIMSMLISLSENTMIVKEPRKIIDQTDYLYFFTNSLLISIVAVFGIWLLVRHVIDRRN